MKYFFLLFAGLLVSSVHFYLVWHHRDNRRYSLSEHAILTKRSYLLYFGSHLICEVLFFMFSYQFFIVEHNLWLPFYLNMGFILLDFVQAALPANARTEKIHFASAYVSWCCYLLAGLIALPLLHVAQPYVVIALLLLIPILGMFLYMHINRSKLYPYQLMIVPLFMVYLLLVTIGSS
jgi:hypothetical protein